MAIHFTVPAPAFQSQVPKRAFAGFASRSPILIQLRSRPCPSSNRTVPKCWWGYCKRTTLIVVNMGISMVNMGNSLVNMGIFTMGISMLNMGISMVNMGNSMVNMGIFNMGISMVKMGISMVDAYRRYSIDLLADAWRNPNKHLLMHEWCNYMYCMHLYATQP